MKLLTTGNPKTAKGAELGFNTAVLHLAPASASGLNVCPMAELAGCIAGCLNTAGRGGIAKGRATFETPNGPLPDNAIQHARIRRTRFYFDNRPAFLAQLTKEIAAHVKRSEKHGLWPVVRLNGTSDLPWHRIAPELFEAFPTVRFYDYTKVPKRAQETLPANYSVALSYSQASIKYADKVAGAYALTGAPLVIVVDSEETKREARSLFPDRFIDGDAHDLRFLDPAGSVVVLKAKGSAKRDTSGFVLCEERLRALYWSLRFAVAA